MFAALADPTRRTLLDTLSRLGPQNATELGRVAPMSRQAVAKHLVSLEAAGLVTSQRHGREVRYELVRAAMSDATAWLDEVGARWDDRLDALRRHFDPR
ncbi:MAG: metalloregulator ArsR/SmtB family transcription factor [Actinomycetota bacterium]|nr:metalloregulator ArsR/SmtB family transcription factor [Actinomycetota bacterium]